MICYFKANHIMFKEVLPRAGQLRRPTKMTERGSASPASYLYQRTLFCILTLYRSPIKDDQLQIVTGIRHWLITPYAPTSSTVGGSNLSDGNALSDVSLIFALLGLMLRQGDSPGRCIFVHTLPDLRDQP